MQLTQPILNIAPQALPWQRTQRKNSVLTAGRRPYLTRYISALSVCFFLYAALGKGFAYAGYAPLFVGEALLFYGLYVGIKTRKMTRLAQTPIGILLFLLFLWELARTLPFLGTFGIDALRDAMLWAYSLFAWVVAAIVLRWDNCLGVTLKRYRKYGGIMVVSMLASFLIALFFSTSLPTWPGTGVAILFVKPDDMCVHVAGLLSFVLVGLETRNKWWIVPALCAFLIGAMASRGGFLACTLTVGVVFLFYPDFRRFVRLASGLVLVLTVLLASGLNFEWGGHRGTISASQLGKNVQSAFGFDSEAGEAGLDATKQWRLDWWNKIIDYTFRGPYFWTGKGYGINLTVSDGIARDERSYPGLRSPHNSHLSFLARSGVPGIAFWLVLQTTWAFSILSAGRLARRQGREGWARTFIWLFAYWAAFMINAAFDVSLEGPVCAIPFWTVFGLGWGGYLKFRNETLKASLASVRDLRGLRTAPFLSTHAVYPAG